MRILAIIVAAAFLAGCQHDQVTIEKYRVILPPDYMYQCPAITEIPNPDTLTDHQVAELLVKLAKGNAACRASVTAIKNFLTKAKTTVER